MDNNNLNDNVIVRRVTLEDDFSAIAELIYKTDDYIYPYWFHNSIEECKRVLPSLMKEEGFFYNYKSMYVAVDKKTGKIVGLTCIVLPDTNLEYDYSKLRSVDDHYSFTIDNYVMELIKEVKELGLPYISNVCVDEKYRGQHIGSIMLNHVLKENLEIYKKILLDVLSNNPAAIRLYQNLGFKITSPEVMGIGSGPGDYVGQYSMEVEESNRTI